MSRARWRSLVGLSVGAVVAAGFVQVAAPDAAARDDAESGGRSLGAMVAQAHTRFACDLYGALKDRPGNVVFSPHSISTALWMAHEGAAGETATEMGDVLHRPSSVRADYHADLVRTMVPREVRARSTDGEVEMRPSFRLAVANALWASDDIAFLPAFTDTLGTAYAAPLQRVSFRDTAAVRRRVNAWVSERTNGKVPEILPDGQPSADSKLLLANAIHFTAEWAQMFQERWTKDGAFHVDGERDVTVPFMHRVDQMSYGETSDARVLRLGFKAGDTAFTVILPKDGHDVAELESRVSPDTLATWYASLAVKRVDLKLPRFSSHDAMDLLPVIRELGMSRALSPELADFTGMTTDVPLHISLVLHQADIDVDESGVEAAAATVVGMKVGAAMPIEEPVELVLDRPFLFLLRHEPTGEILFMGRISDPTAR